MKNFIQPGLNVTVDAPAGGAASGDGVLIGALFGVAAYTAPAGAPLEIATAGIFYLPKPAGTAFTVGAKLYWNALAKAVTATAAGNAWIGVAVEGANASAPTVKARLNHFAIT